MVPVDVKHRTPSLISLMVSVDVKHWTPSLISLMVSGDVKHRERSGGRTPVPNKPYGKKELCNANLV